MDMNYLVQRRINAKKAYRRKVVLAITLSVILLALFLVGLIKVIIDDRNDKKAEADKGIQSNVSEQVTPGITGSAAGDEEVKETSGNTAGEEEQTQVPSSTLAPTSTPLPTSTPTPTPVPKKKVAIDPGHGGEDLGSTRQGLYEKDANLAIALYLQALLLDAGYDVYMVRDTDVQLELADRPAMAKESGADMFVSIHLNSIEGDNDSTQGAEVWYADLHGEASEELARYVMDELVKVIDTRNRGIKKSNGLAVLKYSDTMPACLVECGFITSATERAKLFNPEYQQQIAQGIFNGIKKYMPAE